MIAQAEHIPVHLGAMPDAVAAVTAARARAGRGVGPQRSVRRRHAPARHHARLAHRGRLRRRRARITPTSAAREPGSMPADSRTLDEEGVVIPPTRLDDEAIASLVAHGCATPTSGAATCARNSPRTGSPSSASPSSARVAGASSVVAAMDELYAYSERSHARRRSRRSPTGATRRATSWRRIDGDLELHATRHDRGRRRSRSTSPAPRRSTTATSTARLSVARSACFYVVRVPRRPGPARVGRRLRAGHRDRTGRLPRQRPAAGCRRRPATSRRRRGSSTS